MDREELIDLGAASVETQGPDGQQLELSVIGKPFGIDNED
ncbi:benenodin family lasso peptide [Sphingobium chungangianum]